jgi:hypothetical protein
VKTGCIFQARGPGVIAISLKLPKHLDGRLKRFERLAPLPFTLRMEKARYCRHFFGRVLHDLDPLETWNRLHDLADGAEPVLCCYERPPFDDLRNWCHRRMVAAWFSERLGEVVDEIEPAQLRLSGC